MKITIAGRIWTGFGLAAGTMIIVSSLWLVNMRREQDIELLADRTRHIIFETSTLIAQLEESEAGAYGYIITGVVRDLEPYQSAVSNMAETVQHLRQHSSNTLLQRDRIESLVGLVEARMSVLKEAIGLRRDGSFALAQGFLLRAENKSALYQIEAVSSELIAVQTELLEQGRAAAGKLQRQTTLYVVIDSAIVFLVLLAASLSEVFTIRSRLKDLVEGTARLGRGDLGHRIDVTRKDEFEVLGRRFNEMAGDLEQASGRLKAANEELSHHAGMLRMLGAMVRRLEDSSSIEEFEDAVRRFAPDILGARPGVFFLVDQSRNMVSLGAQWNGPAATDTLFVLDDCWGLRRGQPHIYSGTHAEVRCRHVRPDNDGCYACIPLMGHGTLVGLLYLESGRAEGAREAGAEVIDEGAAAFSENVALALVNFRLRETQRMQSLRDPLTSLFNRRYLDEAIELEFARATRSHSNIGVVMADIDHFKSVNDTYGHDCGDAVLQEIGRLLARHARKGDLVCRYGGEEFTIVLPGATSEVACERVEGIRKAMRELVVSCQDHKLGHVTMSFGVAVFPDNGDTPQVVMKASDEALFRAKAEGRDRVVAACRGRPAS